MKLSAAKEKAETIDPRRIKCAVFDFSSALLADRYFKTVPHGFSHWHEAILEHIFDDPAVSGPWMRGEMSSRAVAGIIGRYISLGEETILAAMEEGCRELSLNLPVWNFAVLLRMTGRKIALVEVGPPEFSRVVAPAHKLDRTFDAIVSSAEAHETDKEALWQKAIDLLDGGLGLSDCLLVDGGEAETRKFLELGGYARQYKDEKSFTRWYHSLDWDRPVYG